MNSDKKVVCRARYALSSSTLHNVSKINQNGNPNSNQDSLGTSFVKASRAIRVSPINAQNLCKSTFKMELRSQSRKRNSIDENDSRERMLTRPIVSARKCNSLDEYSQRITKKQKNIDKPKDAPESLISVTQLSQQSLKKPKYSEPKCLECKHWKLIDKVLTEARLNLKERFAIKSNARCIENFELCRNLHSQNIQLCDYYIKNSTKMLLAETRVLNFLKALDGIIFREVFPGVELIIELIGTILTYNDIDKSTTNERIIAGSLNTFHRILFKFPPCIANIKMEYQNLITDSSYKSDIISLPNFEFQNGIFWKLIEMLETLIENDVGDDELINLSQHSEDGYDFYTWEKRQITQHYRHNIPRDDQIDRIFYILHFLIDLMEYEFGNWLQRQQLYNKIGEQPIITGVIWPRDTVPGMTTMNVKRIIKLFTKFVAVNFPKNKIKILSSLINLIGNVMSHVTTKYYYNVYPNRNFKSIEEFVNEIYKIATDVQPSTEHSKIKLYSLIITYLELPVLKMLFGNVVIDKIENTYSKNLNLEKLYRILLHDSWKNLVPKSPKKTPIKTRINNIQEESSDSIYPIYNKCSKKSGKCEDINLEEYIIVIFQTYKSYLNYFKLDVILRELKDPFDSKSNSPTNSRIKTPIKLENNNFGTGDLNIKLVEKKLKKSVKFFDKTEKLNKSSQPNNNNNNNAAVNVKLDDNSLKQYDSDIDVFDKIGACINSGNQVYFKIFKEYNNSEELNLMG